MDNEFLKHPIHLSVIGVNLKSEKTQKHYYLKQLIIFVGNVPEIVFKEINKLDTKNPSAKLSKNKILESYYGENWTSLLGFDPYFWELVIVGSQEEDIFDITSDVEEKLGIKGPEKKSKIKKEEPKEEIVEKEETTDKIIFVRDVHVYPEDRISEFKEKIYLTTQIPIFRQHIFSMLDESEKNKIVDQVIPMRYKIIVDGNINIDIRKIFQTAVGNKILDIPVDSSLFQNREYMQIEALDYFTTLSDVYENFGIRRYYLVDVDEFIKTSKNLIKEMSTNDTYQFQLLYYGFIVKFWPMITLDVFNVYINNESDLKNSYPDLVLSQNFIGKKYEEEKKILDFKYDLLEDAQQKYKKYPDFKKYQPEFSILTEVDGKKDSIMGVAIKSATLSNVIGESVDISSQIKINVRNLFGQFNTNENVPLIRARLLVQGRIITLTKIRAPSIIENDPNDIQKIYEKIKYRLQMPYYNTILFAIRSNDKKNALGDDNYLILNIYDNGKYNIKSIWEEEIQIDFRKIYDIVEKSINPILETINKLGRSVYESVRKLNLIKRSNSEFSSLHMSIFWKMPMTSTAFEKISGLIKEDMSSQIIKPVEGLLEAGEQEAGTYNYFMSKGITEYDTKQLEKSVIVSNYYEYLSNSRVKQKWVSLFEKGRLVNIGYRTADVKIEIQGLKEKEFTNFYQYIISFLYRVEKNILNKSDIGSARSKKTDISSSNTLKLLKSRDPELYIFKRFGSEVVFSRICQKEHQPIPYLPDEYNLLDEKTKKNSVQYWNFTTKSPIFYVCPNKRYPYLNFLVGHHPKGYCLPCCKKTPPYDYELTKKGEKTEGEKMTKKEHVYDVCMQHHVYTEQDTQSGPSRYIMNYGKTIDIGRIGKLPDIIDRYLLYNLEDREILEVSDKTITGDFGFGPKTYSVNTLWKLTKNNKIFEEPAEKYKTFIENKSWSGEPEQFNAIEIIKNPSLSPDHYNRISNADLMYPILVFEPPSGSLVVLDGIHRIAKIFLDIESGSSPAANVNIKVRYVTKKQLAKSEEKPEEKPEEKDKNRKEGGGIKKPGYYLYGVPQNNINVSNIGAGYSIASALNLTFPEFIQKTINYLMMNTQVDYFKILLHGKLNQYFINTDHLITIMTRLFLDETMLLSANINEDLVKNTIRFYLWNELFIDIAKICFGKYIIILDDISVDVTGTSIKSSKVSENVDIVLPEKVIHVDDIIPSADACNAPTCQKISTSHATIEYILLIRKKKKSKSFFSPNRLYYPIFIFVPQIFFKTLNVEKKVFTYKDEIMKLIRNILLESFADSRASSSSMSSHVIGLQQEIDIKVVLQFMNYLRNNKKDCYISKILANSKNMCYALLLEIEFKTNSPLIYYFPVKYSYFNNIPSVYFKTPDNLTYEPFSRKIKNLCDYKSFKMMIEEYNTFVIEESEKQGLYKIVEEKKAMSKLNQRENRILPAYPLIKSNYLLVLLDRKKKKSKIIGIQSSNIFYYFTDVDLTKENLRKIFNNYTDEYNMFSKDIDFESIALCLKYMYYDPDIINENIQTYLSSLHAISSPETINHSKLYEAIYHKYLYNLFVLEFMSQLDQDRDDKMRELIISIISKTNFKDINNTNETKKKLGELLENFPDDLTKVQDQINLYLTTHFDKKALNQELRDFVYQFDRVTWLKLQKMSEDYYKNPENIRKAQRIQLIKYLEKIAKDIIQIGTPKFDQKSFIGNVFVPCSANLSDSQTYCSSGKNRKLLIPKEKFNEIINIFADDIVNPIKRQYLLSSILTSNIQNYFQFEKQKNEEIFIKYG